MKIKEFYEELKTYKHHEINFYMMETQKMIKGFIKKVYLEPEDEVEEINFIGIDIKEIKSNDDKLKKYGCSSKEKGENKNNKDRLSLGIDNLSDLLSITKEIKRDQTLYKLQFNSENIGIIIHSEKKDIEHN